MHYTVNYLTNIPHLNDTPVLGDPSYNYLLVIPSNTLNGTPTLGWCTLDMMELPFWGPHAFWAQQSISKVKLQGNVLRVPLFCCINGFIVLGWWCFCLILWEASHHLSWWHTLYWAWSCVPASWVNSHTPFSLCWISALCPCYHHSSCNHYLHTWICAHTRTRALTMTALYKVWMHSQWLLYIKFGCYSVNLGCICEFFWEIKMFDKSHGDMIKGITLFVKWWIAQSWVLWSVWRGVVHRYQCFGRKLSPFLC